MQSRTWLPAFAACVCLAAPAAAQQTITHATVSGRVTDPSGLVVPGADVEARHLETNTIARDVTDTDGRFRLPALRAGRHLITVQLSGFRAHQQALTVSAGSAFELPIALQLATQSESVIVTVDTPVLETARSQVATTVGVAEIRALPLNGRRALDVALLAPGVAPPNINSTQLFAETSAVPGVGLSMNSQRNFSNNVMVDGLSANDDAAGLTGMPYGLDALEEVQVVTTGGQAELGRALGGHLSLVTRSGTNQRRGTLYGFFRDDALNARNALSGQKLPMSQQQVGASFGGPLRRDRTFFFANLESTNLNQSGLTTISAANVAAINARLATVGYPGAPVTTGLYDNPVDIRTGLARVDHVTDRSQQFSLRYSLYDVVALNARGAGGLSSPSASQGVDNRDQALAVSHTRTLGTHGVNELRAQYTHSDFAARASDPIGPAVSISGVASFGTLSTSPQGRFDRALQIVDNVAVQRGAHALRAGVDVVHHQDRIDFPRAFRGSYTFASMAAFLAGTYNNAGFTQTFGATDVFQRSTLLGVHAQDAWTARPSLTLNLGVRYDVQWLETISPDLDNIAPRVGFAWTPGRSSATVVRGTAGLHVDRVPMRALANALLAAGNATDLTQLRQSSIALSPGQAGAPAFPAILDAPVPSVTLVNLSTMDRGLENASSTQASVEIEHQVGERRTISAGYTYVRGRDLLMAINQNVPTCVATGTNNGCRPIADYANDSRYSAAGTSTWHALTVTAVQRAGRWGQYRASYTLGRAMNNVGEFFFSGPIDHFDLSKDWARADNDRRHVFVLSGNIESPVARGDGAWRAVASGWQLGGLLQAYSAAPFTVLSGTTTVQGTSARPIVDGAFIARNTGTGDSFVSLGLRLARTFALGPAWRLETMVEVFNVTDAVNEIARNTTFGPGTYPTQPSPSFGQVTAVGDPRSAQLGVRLRF